MARNYRSEYDNYHGKPVQKKNRAKRNAANRAMKKAGKLKPGQEADHKKPLSKGGSNAPSNLRSSTKKANRSFPRTKNARMK